MWNDLARAPATTSSIRVGNALHLPITMTKVNDGSPFIGLAAAYQKSGDVLIEHMDVGASLNAGLPVRFLYSHAIELYLKAFLSMAGFPTRQLATKKFGHDLTALLQACVGVGLATSTVDPALQLDYVIKTITPGHAQYQTRYLDASFNTVDPAWIQRCASALKTLVEDVSEANRDAFVEAAKAKGLSVYAAPAMLLVSISQ